LRPGSRQFRAAQDRHDAGRFRDHRVTLKAAIRV